MRYDTESSLAGYQAADDFLAPLFMGLYGDQNVFHGQPHLACIAPWEGMSDMYRESLYEGGVPCIAFTDFATAGAAGLLGIDDQGGMARKYPLMNGYWKNKIPPFEKIVCPMYVTAGWNHFHLRGTMNVWRKAASPQKWLRAHREFEWLDFYSPENTEDQEVQKEQGTGLGLPITRSMARLMGGDVTVTSKLGEGSTFFVRLTLKIAEPESRKDESQVGDIGDLDLSGFRCLLVDDNELNREIAAAVCMANTLFIYNNAQGQLGSGNIWQFTEE